MKTNPFILATRAISAEFARRLYVPVVSIAFAVLILMLILVIWLVIAFSAWWWLLLAPLIFVTLVAAAVFVIAWVAIRFVRPYQTKDQKQKVRSLVDTLQNASDVIQTPKVFLFVRLVKDTLFPGKQGLVSQVSTQVSSMRPDFEALVASFKKSP